MLPVLFHTSVWYTPEAERGSSSPAQFLIRTFPYHFLHLLQISSFVSKLEGVRSDSIEYSIITHCIVDYRNVFDASGGIPKKEELLAILPASIVTDLLGFILKIGMYNQEFISKLEDSLHAVSNPRFQDESWNCKTCQKRRLDRQRNCPFLPKEDHDSLVTYPTHSGITTICPIGNADISLVNMAIEARNYKSQALLPEDGGIRNQTVFFMIASQKVDEITNFYEQQRIKDAKKH